jgi:hypothetical protein
LTARSTGIGGLPAVETDNPYYVVYVAYDPVYDDRSVAVFHLTEELRERGFGPSLLVFGVYLPFGLDHVLREREEGLEELDAAELCLGWPSFFGNLLAVFEEVDLGPFFHPGATLGKKPVGETSFFARPSLASR